MSINELIAENKKHHRPFWTKIRNRQPMNIGPTIKKLRRQKYPEFTALDFAESIEMTGALLSQIENGHTKPTLARLQQIASGLECTVSYLIEQAEAYQAPTKPIGLWPSPNIELK